MATSEILFSYILKLSHPLKEIRERSLKLLTAKMQLGWQLEDELAGTRQLLEALLAWFHVQQPSLQKEALVLLLSTLKTKSGNYISKEIGIKKILSSLERVKDKIDTDVFELYDDVMETLRFLNTVQSEDNLGVPRLALPSMTSSESEGSSSNGLYNLGPNFQSSNETSMSNEEQEIKRYDMSKSGDGIKVLLFPWIDLCASDSKTMVLIEDALRLFKSTRRCCRFIRDVFLRDFPPEIFLNRPIIVKSLLTISEGVNGGRPGESLQVLLYITRALCKRLSQLTSLDLIHEAHRISIETKESDESINLELEHIASDNGLLEQPRQEDGLAALRQIAAPIYALDTLHSVLSTMARSVVYVNPGDKCEVLNMKELNTCVTLVEWLIKLLLECVSEGFWMSDHTSKTHRDIAHKSCMIMRLLGDLLMKYSKIFTEDPERCHRRAAWLRLVSCAETLLSWAQDSALPPSSLVLALQSAQLEPTLQLIYPKLSRQIATVLQSAKTSIDQEYKSKYRELTKLFASMEDAVKFMKNKNSCRSTKGVLNVIKKSLPTLEIHQSETYLNDVSDILLKEIRNYNLDDHDWSTARNIALNLMAHNVEWVRVKFYSMLAEMVKAVLMGEANQSENEKCLALLCDVGMLTEICCHGLSSKTKQVENSASEIMLYLLRGRLVLSEGCWWRLLASLLPVLPLLHVYAAHDTQLGQAIWKSLERDIAECMGIPATDVTWGLTRMLFVQCMSIQLEAAHSLCLLLDDDRYLPPKESLRADVLLNALRRIGPQDFNIDFSSSPSKTTQTTGLLQILDVLKQDVILDEDGMEFVSRTTTQAAQLEPSLRRNTLQQLAVMMRQQEFHDTFVQCDGLGVIVATLRMSLMLDDYLAYPECAISCVSILNSGCFVSRHSLLKIPDLPALLLRVILVFPANESAVLLSAQVLALVAWSGFALQELDTSRRKVPALPLSVAERTTLPFNCNSYWHSSPNAEHSSVEWLLASEEWRAAIRVGWWCAYSGAAAAMHGAGPPPAPLALRPSPRDLAALRAACPAYSTATALTALENATSHAQVIDALNMLESYVHLLPSSSIDASEFAALPWQHTRRFLAAPPASSRDTALLTALMQFIITYMDNVPNNGATMSWIKSYFIGNDSTVISLLSRDRLLPHQTPQDSIEVTQLHIHIVKIVLRCVIMLENDDYDTGRMESLVKILLACLDKIDLKNFHMLGFLNELMRCIRYALNSRFCKLSEDTLLQCLKVTTRTLSGCASGGGRKGQACRLDALLSLLALLRQIHGELLPTQRWSECWNSEVVQAVVSCSLGACPQLRAASLLAMTALAHHAQLLPQLLQALTEESLSQFACRVYSQRYEANVVRSGAAYLLTAVSARASPHSDVLELDVLAQLKENNFLESSLEILIDFCNEREYRNYLEPNVPLLLLDRRSELEVRAQKRGESNVSPSMTTLRGRPPPTAQLVAALADVVHNAGAFARCPVQAWNERGLYRLLFRCASWSSGTPFEINTSRSSACRALFAAAAHKFVRATLAGTKDCMYNLLATLTPLEDDEWDETYIEARTQALLLIACLLTERSASDGVWQELRDKRSIPFFSLVLQTLECEEIDFQIAGLYCLSQLALSTTFKRHPDKSKDNSWVEFYDNLKSPFASEEAGERYGAGDGTPDCQPEYMAEELCKAIICLYQKASSEMKKCQTSQGIFGGRTPPRGSRWGPAGAREFYCSCSRLSLATHTLAIVRCVRIDDHWVRVCSCLCTVLSVSPRSRLYGVHRQLPRMVLATLQAVRDQLSVQGKPAEVIRNANNNPVLRTLYWLLTIMDCLMVECLPAKEAFADDSLTVSLGRLWPWCMMTDQLRQAVIHLLFTFTNDCAKAWSCMSSCVGGRSLAGEACRLASREAALQSRTRGDSLLITCIHTLRHCLPHHQCRAILIKSDVLSSLYKLAIRDRIRGMAAGGGGAGAAWARLCEGAARHADGAAAVLALRPHMAALPPALRASLLPALAHGAAHQRITFLQSPDLLELLSGTLLAGDTAEVVSAARAAWSLAANNHKAKLQLRSAGVAAAVQSAVQRFQRRTEPAALRAIQLLTYTNTVLQAT